MTPEQKLAKAKKRLGKLCRLFDINLEFNKVDNKRKGIWCTVKYKKKFFNGTHQCRIAKVFLDSEGTVLSNKKKPKPICTTIPNLCCSDCSDNNACNAFDLYFWLTLEGGKPMCSSGKGEPVL
jgi:hypothetical protein